MKPALDHASAVALLRDPRTWKKGARALVTLGDAHALLDLMRAYELPVETSRLPLLDAMDRLGPSRHAAMLFAAAPDDDVRRLVVHLVELFPAASHLEILAHASQSGSPTLRRQAARSLVCQPRSPQWQALVAGLLGSPDEIVRRWAEQSLQLDAGKQERT